MRKHYKLYSLVKRLSNASSETVKLSGKTAEHLALRTHVIKGECFNFESQMLLKKDILEKFKIKNIARPTVFYHALVGMSFLFNFFCCPLIHLSTSSCLVLG